MKPKQMQKHLSKMRKGLIQSNKKRPQSASPARTTSSSLLTDTPPHTSRAGAPVPGAWDQYGSPRSSVPEIGAYDLYSPGTLSPATSLQSGLSAISGGVVAPYGSGAMGHYGRETTERYGYDLHTGASNLPFHARPQSPASSRTSSKSPPREYQHLPHHHQYPAAHNPQGYYSSPPPPSYGSVSDGRYYSPPDARYHEAPYYGGSPHPGHTPTLPGSSTGMPPMQPGMY